jgi:hypothetical protein
MVVIFNDLLKFVWLFGQCISRICALDVVVEYEFNVIAQVQVPFWPGKV